jgi:ABC-type uncharacterized transport system ATPase subunit
MPHVIHLPGDRLYEQCLVGSLVAIRHTDYELVKTCATVIFEIEKQNQVGFVGPAYLNLEVGYHNCLQ